MTVKDLIKRLEKIEDKNKMCIYGDKNLIGWSNINMVEKDNEIWFVPDFKRPFSDD